MSSQNFKKRMTFQGLFEAEKEKIPERSSRSRSKSRSKASSITKSAGGGKMTNRSWRKTEPKNSFYTQQSQPGNQEGSNSETIFRQKKRRVEQDLMKKIIKLKNTAIKIEANFKQQLSQKKQPSKSLPNASQTSNEFSRFTQIQDYLEQFDAEVRRQTKQLSEKYLKKLDEEESKQQKQQHEIPTYNYLTFKPSFGMPTLQGRLCEIQSKWNF